MNSIDIPTRSAFSTVQEGLAAAVSLADDGQIEAALDLYRALSDAYPDNPDTYLRPATILLRQARADDAAALLRTGQSRFPNDIRFAADLGWLLLQKREFPLALAQWEMVRERFGKHAVGYIGGAATLREMKRLDEAEVLLTKAISLFPSDAGVRIEHAWVAHRRLDREEALRRWSAVRNAFPTHPAGFTGAAATLTELGRLDDAQSILADAIKAHPDDRGIAIEFARVAHRRKDWQAAIERWDDVRARFSQWSVGFTGGAESLREAGRAEEAERLLVAASERWPNDLAVAAESAWLAYHRKDWQTSADRWESVRTRFPNVQSGYLAGARALQAAGRFDQAVAVLAAAGQRWPNDPSIAASRAELVHTQGDREEAIRIGRKLIEQFPNEPAGYFHAARGLRELGRDVEAEVLLGDVAARFPADGGLLSLWASISMGQENWPEAVRRWRLIQERFPADPRPFWHCAQAMTASGKQNDAEALLKEAVNRFPADPTIAFMYADALLRRGDAAAADAEAARVRRIAPSDASGYALGLRARRILGELDDVADLLQEMLDKLPTDRVALRLWAEDAVERGDWAAAEERWSDYRSRFPDDPAGYIGGATAQREAGWPDGADALLMHGIDVMPRNVRLLTEYAHSALRRKNWSEAVARWDLVRRHLPDSPLGYLGGAQALRDAVALDAAEALLRQGVDLFPKAFSLAAEYLNIARIRRDAALMIERSRLITERFPKQIQGFVNYAEALSVAGRHQEAEAILRDAQRRFPDKVEPFAEYAQIAIRQGEWASSLERWEDALRRFPDQEFLSHRIFEARMRVAEVDPEQAVAKPGMPQAVGETTDMSEIVKAFESLGGAGHGCEFGLFQRAYGAEPLGLLRWADLGSDLLIAALESRFDGVGLPENTVVFAPPSNDRPEYWTRDRRYWMAMRCFIPADEVPYEKMVVQACRRIQFLRRKLIDDLSSDEKIFVFKSIPRNLTDDEVRRLHRAVRNYGDNTLLYVRYEDADNPNGSVRVAAPGLMIGYVDRFAFSPEDKDLGPAVDRWAAVCTRAYAIWKAGGARGRTAESVARTPAEPLETRPAAAHPTPGALLTTGPGPDQPPPKLGWSAQTVSELRRTVSNSREDSREHAFASIMIDAFEGNHASARDRIRAVVDRFESRYPADGTLVEQLLVASVIAGQWDIPPRLLRDRFGEDWCAAVGSQQLDPPGQMMRWEIDQAGKAHFQLSSDIFKRDRTAIELLGWTRSMTLFHDYTNAPDHAVGSVIVSLGDAGGAPGLAPSENRQGYYLVPDSVFLNTNGYEAVKAATLEHWVPWSQRKPIAFWRGSNTGQRSAGWRKLPRVRLCTIGKSAEAVGLIDAGITTFFGLSPEDVREAEALGLKADFVASAEFIRYKYQIDIDGNTNAWASLFQKLLTGSPVLKVRSPFDYRQWYYDDLIPWENYVPVAAEMGDLIEKTRWLRDHDEAAERIGQAGLTLARSMTHAGEMKRARATISAAIRFASGRPEVTIPFGGDVPESRFLIDGWSGLATAAGVAGRYAIGPESRVRFPRPASEGDLQLRLTLAAGDIGLVDPFRMIVMVNGQQVLDTVVSSVGDVVCIVPSDALAASSQTAITLLFPGSHGAMPLAFPAGLTARGLLFTRLQLGLPGQ